VKRQPGGENKDVDASTVEKLAEHLDVNWVERILSFGMPHNAENGVVEGPHRLRRPVFGIGNDLEVGGTRIDAEVVETIDRSTTKTN
jgi:hypothetical protein